MYIYSSHLFDKLWTFPGRTLNGRTLNARFAANVVHHRAYIFRRVMLVLFGVFRFHDYVIHIFIRLHVRSAYKNITMVNIEGVYFWIQSINHFC